MKKFLFLVLILSLSSTSAQSQGSSSSRKTNPVGSFLAADYTNITAAFTPTALSVQVTIGRKYTITANILFIDSVSADGAQFNFNGGTATATDYRMRCSMFDTVLLNTATRTTLATGWSGATTNGASQLTCAGSLEPSASGTFILQAAQVAHTTGTLTVNRGSFMNVNELP